MKFKEFLNENISDIISVCKRIKHCGDCGYCFYNEKTKTIFWTSGDSDGADDSPEYTSSEDIKRMFLELPNVKRVTIEYECLPSDDEGFKKIYDGSC